MIGAIHLASIEQIRKELSAIVTYDHRLFQACADLGLPLAAPAE